MVNEDGLLLLVSVLNECPGDQLDKIWDTKHKTCINFDAKNLTFDFFSKENVI